MFCTHCGGKIPNDSNFCVKCGNKVDIQPDKLTSTTTISQNFFYSKDWTKSGLHIASIPHFDILITQEYFYLIKFPKSNASAIGLILGMFFSIIGMAIGAYIGSSIEKNKREDFRARWINSSGALITNEYENNYYLKIPVTELKNVFAIVGNKITITFQGRIITLKGKKNEANRLFELSREFELI